VNCRKAMLELSGHAFPEGGFRPKLAGWKLYRV
jgi:hypothetical protein